MRTNRKYISANGNAQNRKPQHPPDTDPEAILAAAIWSRPHAGGITIDPPQTILIDDGVWIEKNPQTGGWTVRTFIADLPAMMAAKLRLSGIKKSQTGEDAQKQGDLTRSFPPSFLAAYVSLQQGQPRPALAFIIELSADGQLLSYDIARKIFTSLRKCDLSPLHEQFNEIAGVVDDWHGLAYRMQENRLNAIADECDRIAAPLAYRAKQNESVRKKNQQAGMVVQELMRLTNAVASDYIRKNGLTVPFKHQASFLHVSHVSDDPLFDKACDKVCRNIIRKYSARNEPKIRLSSPMRIYADYITMQVLVRRLEGQKESPVLKQESSRLSEAFRLAAQAKQAKAEASPWHEIRARQGDSHPFDRLTSPGKNPAVMMLEKLSAQNGWMRTDVAVRQVHVQGGYLYMVGMQQKLPLDLPAASGPHVRTWAVALNLKNARELAAHRMLCQLRGIAGTGMDARADVRPGPEPGS